jgi:hypothetical protein
MLDSKPVADAIGSSALAFGVETRPGRIGPASRPLAEGRASDDPLLAIQRQALRHRLLEMILRNEQRRKLKPR